MGLNNEYRDDALFANDDYVESVDDDGDDDHLPDLDPESWHDWHSEDLLNMWMSLRTYLEDNGMSTTLLNRAQFHDFCEFVRFFSV